MRTLALVILAIAFAPILLVAGVGASALLPFFKIDPVRTRAVLRQVALREKMRKALLVGDRRVFR